MSTSVSDTVLEVLQGKVDERTNRWTSGPAIVLYLATFKLLLHVLVASRYSYFADELYFIACSEHLDWGYVDHPPLIAFVTKAVRLLSGDSLLSLRFLPAIAGAALVCLTGAMTRTLGGGRFAQSMAALGVIALPLYLSFHYILSMNAFEPLFWTGLAYVVLLAAKRNNPRLLLWAGVILGFGLLNKYSILLFAFALCLGLLFTPYRKLLANRWLRIGLGCGFLIVAPHLNWLILHVFPFLEWQRNLQNANPNPHIELSPPVFMLQQLFLTGTASLLWLAGLVFYFVTQKGKTYRFLGWAFVITMLEFIAMHGKNYYPSPVYAFAIAGGAVALEQWTSEVRWKRFRAPLIAVIIAGTAVMAPMFIPILPVDSLLSYQKAIGMHPPPQDTAMLAAAPLWTFLGGQFGWESVTAKVADVYNNLPVEERSHVTIFARTYPPAAAIDFYGKQYGLPKAISTHLGYYLWGPRDSKSGTVIFVGYSFEAIAPICRQAEIGAQIYSPYGWDINHPIVLCRGFVGNFQDLWSLWKLWY
jgi:hypothetical protein